MSDRLAGAITRFAFPTVMDKTDVSKIADMLAIHR